MPALPPVTRILHDDIDIDILDEASVASVKILGAAFCVFLQELMNSIRSLFLDLEAGKLVNIVTVIWRMRAEATDRLCLESRSEKNLRQRRYKKVFRKKQGRKSLKEIGELLKMHKCAY